MKKCNAVLWSVLLTGLLGCGPSGLPTGSVSGNVTQAGEPLTDGTVTLYNGDTGVGASAELDDAGAFQLETVRTGEYQVAIQPPGAPSPEELEAGVKEKPSSIPDQYRDPQASGLSISVSQGENTADFEIP